MQSYIDTFLKNLSEVRVSRSAADCNFSSLHDAHT